MKRLQDILWVFDGLLNLLTGTPLKTSLWNCCKRGFLSGQHPLHCVNFVYEVSPQHYLVWLWTGVRRPANKSFLVCICVNKKCKVTKDRFLLSPSSCSFSFSSLRLDGVLSLPPPPNGFVPVHLLPSSPFFFPHHLPQPPFLSPQEFFLIWRLVLFLCVFNCHSFHQPSFL